MGAWGGPSARRTKFCVIRREGEGAGASGVLGSPVPGIPEEAERRGWGP